MTPEAAAEEKYPKVSEDKNPGINKIIGFERAAFKAGHHSRDPEVERLVEALRLADDLFLDMGLIGGQGSVMHENIRLLRDKIEEALKQYQP